MNINENSENQGIIVGDNSGTINNGLSVEQAFKIANVLFEANFPSLQEQARIVAKNRADEICLEIFSTLKKNGFNNYNRFSDPDIQYALLKTQEGYARKGTPELKEVLCKTVISRLDDENDLLKITLDEAIEIVPLLTQKQMDMLSLKFLIAHVTSSSVQNIPALCSYISQALLPFAKVQKTVDIDIRHIDYCGCGKALIGRRLGAIFTSKYNNIFNLKDPNKPTILAQEKDILTFDERHQRYISVQDLITSDCPASAALFELYNSSIFSLDLTSVGILIGAINAEIKLNTKFDLSLWIH